LRYYPAPQHPAYIQGTSASKPAQHPNTTNLYTKYSKKQHSTPTEHTCTQNRAEAKQQKKTQKQNNKTKEQKQN